MGKIDLRRRITEIMSEPSLHMWEDASESYCMLQYAALTHKKVILLFDKAASEGELSYSKRFIASFNVELYIFDIYFNQAGGIIPASDPHDLIKEIEKDDYVLLKYKSRDNRVLVSNTRINIDCLNKSAVSLVLPNYRDRCEDMYLYYSHGINKLLEILMLLNDEISDDTFLEIIRVFATNGIYKLNEYTRQTKYFDCYSHRDDEIWVNCGSCDGDTILNYLMAGYGFSKIFAIEGDKKLFDNLQKNISLLGERITKKVRTLNYFIGGENDKNNFDNLFKHTPVSLINMDIEGYEMPVLRGAVDIIKRYRPVLAICAYHVKSDLYEIPTFINGIVQDYSFYLRKYCSYEGNAFNEFLYYCVPNERRL